MKTKIAILIIIFAITVPLIAADKAPKEDIWQDEPHFRPSPEMAERIAEKDPNKAEQLRKLHDEDPKAFHDELKKMGREHFRKRKEGTGQKGRARRDRSEDGEHRGHGRMRERMRDHAEKFVQWFEQNYPEKAAQLKKIEEENPELHKQQMLDVLKQYGPVYRAEKRNPQLAATLKKDIELKDQSNSLVKQIKTAETEKEKKQLTAQLEDVLNQRFDIIVQRKQLQYDEMKKKLENLEKKVAEKQSTLKALKKSKEKEVEARIEELLKTEEKLNWD